MSAELDMSQYLDLFLQEAEEQLEVLEQETLKLEEDPAAERLQTIFRAAHTLKGSSRAMGLAHFAELTHEMENVLDQLRNGQLSVSTHIADLLLACIDTLSKMADSVRDGQGDDVPCEGLVTDLQSLSGAAPKADATEPTEQAEPTDGFASLLTPEGAALVAQAAETAPVLHAKVRLTADCVMKFARAFMAINAAEANGSLVLSVPERSRLEDEEFDQEFELFCQWNGEPDELLAKLQAVSEVEWCSLTPWVGALPDDETMAASTDEATASSDGRPEGGKDAKPQAAGGRKAETGQTVRVDVARLDNLMNLVGELVIDRTRIAQIGSELAAEYRDDNVDALAETVGHIARITGDLQDQIMKARMLPIETVFNRLPRVVRDLTHKLDKDIKLELRGGETELDRSVIEVIGDPLLHILRNSVDHGIEPPDEREAAGKPRQGHIVLSAKHQENHIVIEISDDGSGIDVEKVRRKAVDRGLVTKEAAQRMSDKEAMQLVFASGLSTSDKVSEVSGRGVGMDIVRSNIQRLGGIIDLDSTVGEGTRTLLRLPLTLAIIRGLLVRSAKNVFVIPLTSVIETLLVDRSDIQHINKHEVIVIRGLTTPLLRMRELFSIATDNSSEEADKLFVVIVGLAEQRLGIVVDGLIGEHEVVIKSLSSFCGEVRGVSGATILGDGNVALIVDVNGIVPKERI